MQAKKFEAKSMKEALQLVKQNLGPEAIVLGVQEKKIWGERKGVEITAVISEKTLQKKKWAESKLSGKDKKKFQHISARAQKEFIEKTTQNLPLQSHFKRITSLPYIAILDEDKKDASPEKTTDFPSSATHLKNPRPKENPLPSHSTRSASSPSFSPSPSPPVSRIEKPPFSMKRKWIKSPFFPPSFSSSYQGSSRTSSNNAPQNLKETPFNTEKSKELLSKTSSNRKPSSLKSTNSTNIENNNPKEAFEKNPNKSSKAEEHLSLKKIFKKNTMNTHHFIDLDFIEEKLSEKSFNSENIKDILSFSKKNLPEKSLGDKSLIEAFIAKYLFNHIKVCTHPQKEPFQFFIGPSGSGKTMSLIKTASHMILEEKKKVAFVHTSQGKIGDFNQLETFSNILRVPFLKMNVTHHFNDITTHIEEWKKKEPFLQNTDCFLIDGLSIKSQFNKEKETLFPSSWNQYFRFHYVQSLLLEEKISFRMASSCQIPFQDVIFTHLDESEQYGMIYNFQKQFQCPIHSFGMGESIPDDFEWATKERFLDLIFEFVQNSQDKKKNNKNEKENSHASTLNTNKKGLSL